MPKPIALSALLIALSVAMGYLFTTVPNVELFTATIFISGYLVGVGYGTAVGGLAALIYSLFNPYGTAAPPLLLAQIASMIIVGGAGGMLARFSFITSSRWLLILVSALSGFILTLLYDIATTLSFAIFMSDYNWNKILSIFASGSFFYATHVLLNTLIFLILVPLVIVRVKKSMK